MISGYYQQPNEPTSTVIDSFAGGIAPQEATAFFSPMQAAKSDSMTSSDSLSENIFYTPDTVWNTNINFLEGNPLTGVIPPASHEVLYGVTITEPSQTGAVNIITRRQVKGEDWITGLMLIVTLLLAWISIFYGKYYSLLKDSVLNFQISVKLFNEKNILFRRVSLILDMVYLLVIAVFLYNINLFYEILAPDRNRLYYLVIIFAAILVYTLLRIIMLRLIAYIFNIRTLIYSYVHHMALFNRGLGIILFPLMIALLFMPQSLAGAIIIAGLAAFAIALSLKAVRALKIIMWKDVLFVYMILYFCTLEILPLLLGYKLLKSLILSY